MEDDRTIAYQRKMGAEYFANQFKKDYWPADFDGILVDANYLDITDLVNLHKAAKALKTKGYEDFAQGLILYRQSQKEGWSCAVRVNPQYMDEKRQRNLAIYELLQEFFFGDCESYATIREEFFAKGDDQLAEMLRQVEEALNFTAAELEVIIDAES